MSQDLASQLFGCFFIPTRWWFAHWSKKIKIEKFLTIKIRLWSWTFWYLSKAFWRPKQYVFPILISPEWGPELGEDYHSFHQTVRTVLPEQSSQGSARILWRWFPPLCQTYLELSLCCKSPLAGGRKADEIRNKRIIFFKLCKTSNIFGTNHFILVDYHLGRWQS